MVTFFYGRTSPGFDRNARSERHSTFTSEYCIIAELERLPPAQVARQYAKFDNSG